MIPIFAETHLISLDHDLNPQPDESRDPGTGLDVAKLLASHQAFCPVIIHSTNAERAWSMHNELRFAGWPVERAGPLGEDWVRKLWLPVAREMLAQSPRREVFHRPSDHVQRMQRTLVSLEGLAIGDAVGEMLAYRHQEAALIIEKGLSAGPWFHTDDTEMALSIVDILKLYGFVDQDALARRFAWRFERDSDRGYGSMTRVQLGEILRGGDWRQGAASAFNGQGSMGNGSLVTAPDTVPFAVWCALHHLNNYVDSIALTISGDGDCDTNAAIVGGIVALSVGRDGIPATWRRHKEKLPFKELSEPNA